MNQYETYETATYALPYMAATSDLAVAVVKRAKQPTELREFIIGAHLIDLCSSECVDFHLSAVQQQCQQKKETPDLDPVETVLTIIGFRKL